MNKLNSSTIDNAKEGKVKEEYSSDWTVQASLPKPSVLEHLEDQQSLGVFNQRSVSRCVRGVWFKDQRVEFGSEEGLSSSTLRNYFWVKIKWLWDIFPKSLTWESEDYSILCYKSRNRSHKNTMWHKMVESNNCAFPVVAVRKIWTIHHKSIH